jgi:hypothetical protein
MRLAETQSIDSRSDVACRTRAQLLRYGKDGTRTSVTTSRNYDGEVRGNNARRCRSCELLTGGSQPSQKDRLVRKRC